MLAVPGGPTHWLPLVTVDYVANLLTTIVEDPPPPSTELLALDPTTPSLAELVGAVARTADRQAPHRRVPLALVRLLASAPLLRRLVATYVEGLAFIRTER